MDDAINESSDLRGVTNWPFLGSVPKMNAGRNMTEFEKDIFVLLRISISIEKVYYF